MSILIVEDNPVNARILTIHLQKAGYETIVAHSAEEALECLMSNPRIRLVITDIMMSGMSGLQLLDKIKALPDWKDIPVIMCSSLADLETVKKAMKAGCKHYLIKPVDKNNLLRNVREALKHSKLILKDKKDVMTRLGLDKNSYEEVADIFLAMVNEKIIQLEKQTADEDPQKLSIHVSELSENAISFGAERLAEVLEKLSPGEIQGGVESHSSNYSLLLKELKLVKDALEGQTEKAKISSKAKPSEKDVEKSKKTVKKS
ncbi:MAG: response regulator [Deltaproteobacteria bacterium]|jgi:CheY-like chemotaxis protein|nr:response regulator [Deltaproteobacteria bacterium]